MTTWCNRQNGNSFGASLATVAAMNALTPHALLQQAPGAPLDADPEETAEWRDAFLALAATQGPERARHML